MVGHFLPLLVEGLARLLLLGRLFFLGLFVSIALVAIITSFIVVIYITGCGLRLVASAAITTSSAARTTFVFFSLSSILGCGTTVPPVACRLWSLRCLSFVGRSLSVTILNPILFLLLLH